MSSLGRCREKYGSHWGLQAKTWAWRDWARVAGSQLAAPGYIPGQWTKLVS